MTQINQLTAIDTLVSADNLPVYSSSNGDARRASMAAVLDYIEANYTPTITPGTYLEDVVDDVTPQLGGNLDANGNDIVMGTTGGDVELTPSPSSDLSSSGITAIMTVAANATGIGAALYMTAAGELEEADADAAATMPIIALALETGTGSKKVLLQGFLRNDAWSWTAGDLLYGSTTTGAMTHTAPSGTGDQVQVLGVATHAYRVYFKPDLALIEVA